ACLTAWIHEVNPLPPELCNNAISVEKFFKVLEFLCPKTELILGIVFLSGRMVLNPEKRNIAATNYWAGRSEGAMNMVNSFNWVELDDFLSGDISEDDMTAFAETVRMHWQASLTRLYMEHQIVVKVLAPHETGGGHGVGFEQCPPKHTLP
uniref:hypothetical protein n=1 Tax=Frigidibacter sp. SD6-1 TaxID=3032581 RepID=UPI0024DFD003